MNSFKHSFALSALAAAALLPLLGCPPPPSASSARTAEARENQTYMAAPNRIFDQTSPFDLTWNVVYESKEKPFDPAINVSNRELALGRCQYCHECAFPLAFDLEDFGKPTWSPIYKGERWAPVVRRMVDMPNSFMNEQIAERVYNYLKEETLGIYDESKDPRGQNTIAGRTSETMTRNLEGQAVTVPKPRRR